jgi:hypothetical protein
VLWVWKFNTGWHHFFYQLHPSSLFVIFFNFLFNQDLCVSWFRWKVCPCGPSFFCCPFFLFFFILFFKIWFFLKLNFFFLFSLPSIGLSYPHDFARGFWQPHLVLLVFCFKTFSSNFIRQHFNSWGLTITIFFSSISMMSGLWIFFCSLKYNDNSWALFLKLQKIQQGLWRSACHLFSSIY